MSKNNIEDQNQKNEIIKKVISALENIEDLELLDSIYYIIIGYTINKK